MKYSIALISLFVCLLVQAQDYVTKIVVAQDGSGDFTSIQEAINSTKAFPDKRIEIHIKEGIYREKVRVYAWNTNLSMIGAPNGRTVITYDDHFKKLNLGRNSTFHTYTFKVEANDFYASQLTIENSAGDVGQAVAIHVEADRVVFQNCHFYGHQDTMYLAGEGSRHYFLSCIISGTTDFIFGSATAIFERCTIISKKSSYITAASTPEGVDYGLVFLDCKLTSEGVPSHSVYLGRPWRSFAKTVFIRCEMGNHIHPAGWKEWHNGAVFYAEYESKGPGGKTAGRVDWSNQLMEKQIGSYIPQIIFRGWNPMDR